MTVTPGVASGSVSVRHIEPKDLQQCAKICFDAFASIADRHRFPRDFPSVEAAEGMLGLWIGTPGITGLVAESEGRVIASNFVHHHDETLAIGPCTVAPEGQGARVGRRLMLAAFEITRGAGARSARGVEDSYNMASNALYASLGMDLVETLALMSGKPTGALPSGVQVRPLEERDLEECGALARRVHGFERTQELRWARQFFPAFVAVREGRIRAYASALTLWPMNHGVAESDEDMQALLCGASSALSEPIGLLVPRRTPLFRWALGKGLRMLKPMNLVVAGEYREPRGSWFPNVLY